MPRGLRVHTGALLAYAALALAVSWPLPLHLGTHLTGAPSGDTGVYVWNLWVFRHELVDHHRWPLVTEKIFPLSGTVNLSQHNYTVLSDVLALPLLSRFDLVTTFNLIYFVQVVSAGYALFLLARHVTGRVLESWLAGACFAAAPAVVVRSLAHHSLLWVAPVALFLLGWLKYVETARPVFAVAAGAAAAAAMLGDAYYGVYCALLGAALLATWVVTLHVARRPPDLPPTLRQRVVYRLIDAALAAAGALVLWLATGHRTTLVLAGRVLHLESLYTPVLVLTVLVLVRLWLAWRVQVHWAPVERRRVAVTGALLSAVAAALLLAPLLAAAIQRVMEGTFETPPIYWRSSPRGVDLVSFVLPNPVHPWFGAPFARWIDAHMPMVAFIEGTASLSLAATIVILWALWARRGALPRTWLGLTALSGLLALGPFVHVAGVNLYVPGPWAILRYVPVVGLARSPSRFALLAALGHAVLFAAALAALRDRWRLRPRWCAGVTAAVGLALAVELLPVPRTLHRASVPSIYATIAADPDERHAVLELPVGLRDGTSSIGNQSARSQFYQAFHGKPILGGYLSRVSARRKARYRSIAVMNALFTLSEGRPLEPHRRARLLAGGRRFAREAGVYYVVIDTARASPALRDFAVALLDLVKIEEAEGLELYVLREHLERAPPPAR